MAPPRFITYTRTHDKYQKTVGKFDVQNKKVTESTQLCTQNETY